ncbi:MAG: hypothetical protein LBH00_00405 [Planctomycetaceae bacterium]|jgi:hypothetical protein|nr:hypothetical protein [Planctomycetaceae bacterium]
MVHELILTSVSQGLHPDDSGFCPVAADESIPLPLIRFLTALSVYRHINTEPAVPFPPNPAVYSHLIFDDNQHVLSRIAAAGIDYQHQPNSLAHHIVLDDRELVPEGPGWLLGLAGFHLTEWTCPAVRFPCGRPIPTLTAPQPLTRRQQIARQYHWLDPRKIVPVGTEINALSPAFLEAVQANTAQMTLTAPPLSPCPAWQEITGDAGWGGVLAETALTGQAAVILFRPEQNLLPLFIEALAMVPHGYLWQTTFSTYFTGLPENMFCQWKGVLAGSREASQILPDPDVLVIDLTVPAKPAPAGKYVEFARSGYDHLLPSDSDEWITAIINSDTKPYANVSAVHKPKSSPTPAAPPQVPAMSVYLPRKPAGLFGRLLKMPSRVQFYVLYSIMLAMVLFLLLLVLKQAGYFPAGTKTDRFPLPDRPVAAEQNKPSAPPNLNEAVHTPPEIVPPEEEKHPYQIAEENWEKDRKSQSGLLREVLIKNPAFPDFLPMPFPAVEDSTDEENGEKTKMIRLPERAVFPEWASLYPFGAALELDFVPLFDLPGIKIEVVSPPDRRKYADNPAQVLDKTNRFLLQWDVYAEQTAAEKTTARTHIFSFALTETGLSITLEPEGVTSQHLYETVLLSLAFLRVSAAGLPPEETVMIPLFAPAAAEPMKIAALADLKDADAAGTKDEYRVKLPLADEPRASALAELKPKFNIVFEYDRETLDERIRITGKSPKQELNVRTSQRTKITDGDSETLGDCLWIPFTVECSADAVVWKNAGLYAQTEKERDNKKTKKEEREKQRGKLQTAHIAGTKLDEGELFRLKSEIGGLPEDIRSISGIITYLEAGIKLLDNEILHLDDILSKLPAGYKDIPQNMDDLQFPYKVYLESPDTGRKLLILDAK